MLAQVDGSRLQGATFCPTDGFLRPDVIYMEGFRRFTELGGVLIQNSPVMDPVRDRNGTLVGVRTAAGDAIEGDLFINATNAWAPRLSERLGGLHLPISALKRYLYFVHRAGVDGQALLRFRRTVHREAIPTQNSLVL